MRRLVGALGALGIGLLLAAACAGSAARPAEAGPVLPPSGSQADAAPVRPATAPLLPDAGATSSFVVHAQRGEVSPPDLSEVEQMCALLMSCDKLALPPTLIPSDFQACVKKTMDDMSSPGAVFFSLTMRECGLRSTSCANLRACVLRGANPDACVGRGKQNLVVGFCDVDGRALTCWREQILSVRDCPRGGEQCIVLDGQATCTLGPCPQAVKEGEKPRCSGSASHLLHCEKGKLASLDCAAFGLKCSTAADGTAACATAAPGCTADAKRCEGEVAVGCHNGHEVRVDCASAGLTCKQTPGATAVGACFSPPRSPADACNPIDKPRCDDATLKYCYSGAPRSFLCKIAGFSRCETTKNGVRCGQ